MIVRMIAVGLLGVLMSGAHACGQTLQWSIERVDPGTSVPLPRGSSLALAADGTPHVLYFFQSPSGSELRHATKSGATWLIETVDTFPRIGDRTAVSIDSGNGIHIVYNYLNSGGSGGQVRYGVLGASGWQLQDVNPVNIAGRLPNMTLDANDQPRLTFIDNGGTLFATHYATLNGQSWSIETVGPTGLYGFTGWDLAADSAGTPYVAGRIGSTLYVATRSTGGVWSLENAGRGGHEASIVLDGSGNPMVGSAVLNDDDLRFAAMANGTWTDTIVMHLGPGAKGPSLALDAVDQPRMTFETDLDGSGRTLVRHAYLEDNQWIVDLVNPDPAIQSATFLVVDADGFSHVVSATENGGVFYATAYVPEPATLSLLALGATALLKRRRKPCKVGGGPTRRSLPAA